MSADHRLTNPICVALDTTDRTELDAWSEATRSDVGCFKVGLTTFASLGPSSVLDLLPKRRPVFLDLKLHDIPAQVGGAIAAVADLGATLTTVHASGGPEMVAAAAAAAPEELAVLAVTILTSMDESSLGAIGMAGSPTEAVLRLAEVALDAGADGLVCSPLEVAAVRSRFGAEPLLVVPGIRPEAGGDDQRRVATPMAAIEAGADILVVGRPITSAPDPAVAARSLLAG